MNMQIPPLGALKTQAKGLRSGLARSGHAVSHAQALELVAGALGFRDWNTLHAAADGAMPFALGQALRGRYLGTPFAGRVLALASVGGKGQVRLTIRFDAPVDVSKFASMQILRRQIVAVVGADGVSPAHTSDGQPHLVLEM